MPCWTRGEIAGGPGRRRQDGHHHPRLRGHGPPRSASTRDITRSYNEARILAAEAGTGVGKSFAYLVPSFAWAIKNEERIVISTATINLQKQLVDKDIPVVQRLFRKQTKAVLVKGRGNYLCKHEAQGGHRRGGPPGRRGQRP